MSLSRRGFIGQSLSAAAAAQTSGVRSGNRPNILYVILEDIGPNLACYGEPQVRTPNLDRFASQSIRFTSAYTTGPVCSASRSSLMTGCYQTQIGAHQHRTWPWNKKNLPAPTREIC